MAKKKRLKDVTDQDPEKLIWDNVKGHLWWNTSQLNGVSKAHLLSDHTETRVRRHVADAVKDLCRNKT
jgi:hypothetical protein